MFAQVGACPYDAKYGTVDIRIEKKETALVVEVVTEHLRILSVNTPEFLPKLTALYGDKEVNKLVGAGGTLGADAVSAKIQRWISRWAAHSPFSGYVVVEKESGKMVGQIILKPVKDRIKEELTFVLGLAEIGYLTFVPYWGKGYGKEFTHAMVHHLVPRLIQENYLVKGHPIREMMATTRPDNIGSNKVLETFMKFTELKERYNAPRMWYKHTYSM